MELDLPVLSFIIWLPIFSAVIVLWLGSLGEAEIGKFVALAASLFTFAASILLYTGLILPQQICSSLKRPLGLSVLGLIIIWG